MIAARIGQLRADTRGVTAVEFALVAPILLFTIMGLSDLCYQEYASAILNGAMQKAGRDSTLETGSGQTAAIDAKVITAVRQIAVDATYTTSRQSYTSFSNIKPEPYSDTNSNGQRDTGECYTDVNNNNAWDKDPGLLGQGGADDVVVYQIVVTYPRIFPLGQFLGWSNTQKISAQTILKNQPFDQQSVPAAPTRCN